MSPLQVRFCSGAFDPGHPEILDDAPEPRKTAFGAIIAAIRARKAAGVQPFTVMSCDNLPGNGQVTKAAVMGLAGIEDPDLAYWIGEHVAFQKPSTKESDVGA